MQPCPGSPDMNGAASNHRIPAAGRRTPYRRHTHGFPLGFDLEPEPVVDIEGSIHDHLLGDLGEVDPKESLNPADSPVIAD